MTEKDLRLDYKRETGINAPDFETLEKEVNENIKEYIEQSMIDVSNNFEILKDESFENVVDNLKALEKSIDAVESEEIEISLSGYVQWLEEKLCKL